MKIKTFIIITILAISPLLTLLPNAGVSAHAFTYNGQRFVAKQLKNHVDVFKALEITDMEPAIPNDPVPFNVDMVNAEETDGGEGVYVAVLDTGLLSDYLFYFPESMVDIKEEWGIGFTHDVFYVGEGGNFSEDGLFSYGPLRSDRGFLTHDEGNPDANGFGWGSGHGTHVTSIITGFLFSRGGQDYWVKGVAPKVTIIPVLVLDDWIVFDPDGNGYFYSGGTDEMVAAGIRYVGDLAAEYGVKIVINMSLGGPSPTEIIEDAIDYAISQGVIVVASAGNSGEEGMDWPGAYPQVISAAAAGWTQEYGGGYYDYYWWWNDVPEKLNTKNKVYDPITGKTYTNNWHVYLTDFSGRPNPDLGQTWRVLDVSAPGAAIRGPYKPEGPYGEAFYAVWGTSQAAPHVSAIAALILERYPWFNQKDVEYILDRAASSVPMKGGRAYVSDFFSGFEVVTYTWKGRDAGYGFLTLDKAIGAALVYARAHPQPITSPLIVK